MMAWESSTALSPLTVTAPEWDMPKHCSLSILYNAICVWFYVILFAMIESGEEFISSSSSNPKCIWDIYNLENMKDKHDSHTYRIPTKTNSLGILFHNAYKVST